VREALYSPEYRDQPPGEVHAALLAQGQYLGSLSTFHRILRAERVNLIWTHRFKDNVVRPPGRLGGLGS
jgi:hypothetical protein